MDPFLPILISSVREIESGAVSGFIPRMLPVPRGMGRPGNVSASQYAGETRSGRALKAFYFPLTHCNRFSEMQMKEHGLESQHPAANEVRFSRCHGLPCFISHPKGALAVQERWPTASNNPLQLVAIRELVTLHYRIPAWPGLFQR